MAVAARVDPKSYFAPDEWAPMARRSRWKGLALLAHAWIVIGLAMAMVVVSPWWLKPLTIPLAIVIIGGRQLGIAILMHDAAHAALHPNLKVNDWVGNHLTTGGLIDYRNYHLAHHKFAQQAEDPDLVLSAPFGLWWVWPVLWLVPQATWLPMITRLRNIAEHACVAKDEPDPLRHARTTSANPVERLLIAPYYVNYHCEHHMFMHLPCYSLPRAHKILKRNGVLDGMLFERGGYTAVLAQASAA